MLYKIYCLFYSILFLLNFTISKKTLLEVSENIINKLFQEIIKLLEN